MMMFINNIALIELDFDNNNILEQSLNNTDSLLSIDTYTPTLNENVMWRTDYYLNIAGGYTEQLDKWKINYFNIFFLE